MQLAGIRSNGGEAPPDLPDGHRGNGAERAATVLVVEDEILIRLAVADFLRDSGYRVFEASNAAEAQVVLRSADAAVEVVFSDVTMPGTMDGLALAAWIRREHPDVHVILTSGVASVVPAARHSVAAFVPKPYSYEALAAQIKRLIGR